MRILRYNKLVQLIKPPSPSLNLSKRKMQQLITAAGREAKVLDLGCGNRHLAEHVINIDIEPASNIDVVGNGHNLPFQDDTFDLVLCQAVLEHVENPQTVVKDITRILKPDGIIFVEIPFLQGYHADPHDYTRFTIKGIENLFSRYEKIESGVCAGPVSTLCWWIRKFPTIFFLNTRIILGIEFIAGWLTFWIKYFDYAVIHANNAHSLSAGLYFVGKKNI